MRETEEVRDRVVLVGLSSPVLKKEENADEETMEELAALVETAGAETGGDGAAEPSLAGPPQFYWRGQGRGGPGVLPGQRRHHGDF